MARIVIDARSIGTSTGRYAKQLIHHLLQIDKTSDYHVLVKTGQDWQTKADNIQFYAVDVPDYTFAEQLKLWWQIRQLKPDIIHFTMPQQPILPLPGKRVTTIHDLTMLRWLNINGNRVVYYFKLMVFRLLLHWVGKASDTIITPSKWVKMDCVKTLRTDPIKIHITYEAVDSLAAKSEPIESLVGRRFLLFNGNVFPHKNVERLLEAFKLISAAEPDLDLIIAGKLNEAALELKANHNQPNIHWLGFVPDESLRWLMENAMLYIYPSLSEGFGLPGLEAMKYKLPLVSSNATCLPEIYGEAAEYFDPTNTEDMVRTILELINDEERRKQLIKLGTKQIKKYSWAKMAEQTLAIYNTWE